MISGGANGYDGQARVVINGKVPRACADFVANLFEDVLVGRITYKEFYATLADSPFEKSDLKEAMKTKEILYWIS